MDQGLCAGGGNAFIATPPFPYYDTPRALTSKRRAGILAHGRPESGEDARHHHAEFKQGPCPLDLDLKSFFCEGPRVRADLTILRPVFQQLLCLDLLSFV